MADTYEKDLAQKTSLTTSDYIRVVGSDNVSYKQSVDNVMQTLGIKYESLGSFSTQSALETALNTKLDAMLTNSTASVKFSITASFGVFSSGVAYACELRKSGSADYASISLHGLGVNAEIVGSKALTTWTFQKEPTRAEVDLLARRFFTGAYASGTNYTVDFPSVFAGQTWLVNVKHYSSSTVVKSSMYVITLATTTWNFEPIHESGTLAKITSITNSGNSVTFTFDKTAYCSMQVITLNN